MVWVFTDLCPSMDDCFGKRDGRHSGCYKYRIWICKRPSCHFGDLGYFGYRKAVPIGLKGIYGPWRISQSVVNRCIGMLVSTARSKLWPQYGHWMVSVTSMVAFACTTIRRTWGEFNRRPDGASWAPAFPPPIAR